MIVGDVLSFVGILLLYWARLNDIACYTLMSLWCLGNVIFIFSLCRNAGKEDPLLAKSKANVEIGSVTFSTTPTQSDFGCQQL